jgi:hypothetical protein
MQLAETKSILAKLMATENLVVEQRNVQTASFDVKNRVLILPILDKNLSAELYDLFVGHEVGHALYTPLEGMQKAKEEKINMSIVNVVEDSRIERKVKNNYPGLRTSFLKGYKELIEKDFFETKGANINEYNLIDRINLHCKGGASQMIRFSAEERVLLNEVESTETYDEVIEVSKKLEALMRQQEKEKQKERAQDGSPEQGEEVEEDNEDFEFSDSYGDEEDEDGQEQRSGQSGSSGDEEGEDESQSSKGTDDDDTNDDGETSKKDQVKGRGVYDEEQKIQDKLKSFTDEAFKRNEKKLVSDEKRGYTYTNIPKVDLDSIIVDHKQLYAMYKSGGGEIDRSEFMTNRYETNKIVSYLAKEFELRKNADQLKRASISKTGDLNMSKIFSYQFSEDIFKKVTVVPGGKSHGLVMFIDWSGSMHNHINNTMKQLISLVMFCKKVGIPYEVYAFATSQVKEVKQDKKENNLLLGQFQLFNLFSSRMTAAEFTYAGAAMTYLSKRPGYAPDWFSMGSTPLNQAIVACFDIVPYFQKKYRLQMVNTVFLTDGEGDSIGGYCDVNGHFKTFRDYIDGPRSLIIRDDVTKHQEVVERSYSGKQQTEALIKLLKIRTKCNVLGFYLLSNREFNAYAHHHLPSGSNIDAKKLEFRKNKSVVVTNAGFDEYYLMKSEYKSVLDEEFEVRENASTRTLASAFAKYTGGRVANRVVLNRFIGMIT